MNGQPHGRTVALADKIVARSLEVNVTSHCNLSCYGCDHASPVNSEEYLSVDQLAGDLAALSHVYHVFEFRLTGGEPFLHSGLLDIVDTIRRSGIADKIALVTNGVLLHKAPEALWRRIDRLVVSIYPGVKQHVSYDDLRTLTNRHGILLWYKPTNEFTTKLLHAENRDPELLRTIYSSCTLRTSCHTIHQGRYFKCSPSPFMPAWLRRIGLESPSWPADSVAVRDNPDLHRQLAEYLASDKPLMACRYCLGCVGKSTPSRQMNRAAVQSWLSEKDPDIRQLVDWDALRKSQRRNELGIDLTGVLRTTAGLKFRWLVSRWSARLLGIQLTGRPPLMLGPRIKRVLTTLHR